MHTPTQTYVWLMVIDKQLSIEIYSLWQKILKLINHKLVKGNNESELNVI